MIKKSLIQLISLGGRLKVHDGRVNVSIISHYIPSFVNSAGVENELTRKAPRDANAYLLGEKLKPEGRDAQAFPLNQSYLSVQFFKIQEMPPRNPVPLRVMPERY